MIRDNPTCGACRYYDLDRTFCRRHPPVVQDHRHALWPRTMHDDWCGEWVSRTESKGVYVTHNGEEIPL